MIKGSRTAKPLTLKIIHDRCNDVGDCWEWAQSFHRGRASVGEQGRSVNPRRRAFELDRGAILTSDIAVVDTCRNSRCCNPRHLIAIPCTEVGAHMSAQGRTKNSPTGRANKATAARARSEFSMEKAAMVRELVHVEKLTYREVGRRLGISSEQASRVARGIQWAPIIPGASVFNMVPA